MSESANDNHITLDSRVCLCMIPSKLCLIPWGDWFLIDGGVLSNLILEPNLGYKFVTTLELSQCDLRLKLSMVCTRLSRILNDKKFYNVARCVDLV